MAIYLLIISYHVGGKLYIHALKDYLIVSKFKEKFNNLYSRYTLTLY